MFKESGGVGDGDASSGVEHDLGSLWLFHDYPWTASVVSVLLVAATGWLDFTTGWQLSFSLFYLIPISIAAWFAGRSASIAICLGAAAIRLLILLTGPMAPGIVAWNAGVMLGVFLTVRFLVGRLRAVAAHLPPPTATLRHAALPVLAGACLAAAAGWTLYHRHFAPPQAATLDGKSASAALTQLACDVEECLRASRPVLMGSRNPKGPSCVPVVQSGQITATLPNSPGDVDGGPGTTMAMLYLGMRPACKNPMADFTWHQTRLKTWLENLVVTNKPPGQLAAELAAGALRFSQSANAWTSWPEGLTAAPFNQTDDWPSYCLAALNKAVAAKDLQATRRWAAELASAAFSLEDLHSWLGFLAQNQLTGLDFQARCEGLFAKADSLVANYDPCSQIGWFPAGLLGLHGLQNYYEVERQAERIYSVPKERLNAIDDLRNLTAASVWLPPNLRECFVDLGKQLSPANLQTWEQAAHTPYEHSYLVNMLYRAGIGDAAEQLATVLLRFNANHPQATMRELMGVLMYRGHSFGGLEWADRYLPQLMDKAGQIHGTDEEAFEAAQKLTYAFYGGPSNYAPEFTLREAVEKNKLDCVRATDMIGALYRDSGRAKFGHVRWCSGTAGHSLAAMTTRDEDGKSKILLLDGLVPSSKPEIWPDAYFDGHAWPAGLEENPSPYAVELYVHGIDNYVWAEGYIISGENAGTLMKAAVPYLPHRDKATCQLIHPPAATTVSSRPDK